MTQESSVIVGGQARAVAGVLALSAFAVGIISGLWAGNPAHLVLLRATVCMAGCHFVGWMIGIVAERVVNEHLRAFSNGHDALEGAQSTNAERAGGAPWARGKNPTP